jgi:hypothetical protein
MHQEVSVILLVLVWIVVEDGSVPMVTMDGTMLSMVLVCMPLRLDM